VINVKFSELHMNPILISLLEKKGIVELTPIQEQTIPAIKEGKDVVGHSLTGSGKTLAFALPIIDRLQSHKGIQALVVVPTRELCVQVKDVMEMLAHAKGLRVAVVYGGVSIEPQFRSLRSCDVVVATPGRLLDHIDRRSINLTNINTFVLDEVDKMFEMGFVDDVEKIMTYLPKKRQTLLFSATFNVKVHQLIRKHLLAPVVVKTQTIVDRSLLKQTYYVVDDLKKFSLLVHFLKHKTNGLAMVFCGTRDYVDIVAKNLQMNGVNAMPIHGGLSQNQRLYALESLKKENIDVLVATDVAARGLDIKNVTHIYNYDAPKTAEEYIHRIGRTARAGANGEAISFVTRRDFDNFRRVLEDKSLHIQRTEVPPCEQVQFNSRMKSEKRSFGGGRSSGGRGPTQGFSGGRSPRTHGSSRSSSESSGSFGGRDGASRGGRSGSSERGSSRSSGSSSFGNTHRPRRN